MTKAAHVHRLRTRLCLLMGVLLAVLITFAMRFQPAEASVITDTAVVEQGGESIEFDMTDDGLIGYTIKSLSTRVVQGGLPPADVDVSPKEVTKEQLESLKSEVMTSVKEDYGWDVSSSTDRQRIRDEAKQLGQVLHSIPDSSLKLEEHAALPKLRNIVDMLNGESECRGRCLPDSDRQEVFFRVVPLIAIGAAIAALEAEFMDPALPKEAVDTVFTALVVTRTVMTTLIFNVISFVLEIPIKKLQNAAMVGLFSALVLLKAYGDDARKLANAKSSSPKAGAKEEAADISGLTPATDDDPKSYDLVRDEL